MMRFIAVSGFLGAGKTTTLVAAAAALQARGRRVAVVTNDQGADLVDTKLLRSSLDAVAEVSGGCFCCRFEDLMSVVERLLLAGDVDTVIAEAVGSCTDLQATVVRPLRKYHGDRFTVAPLATVVDPLRLRAFARAAERGEPESDLSYLFGRQIAEADIIAVNKMDMVSPAELDGVLARLRAVHPAATVVGYSARSGAGLPELLEAWDKEPSWAEDLSIDYDRYAAAEAQLAWLNQDFVLEAAGGPFSPVRWGRAVLTHLAEAARRDGAEIGHAKLTVETAAGMTKMSVTGTGTDPSVDLAVDEPAAEGRAVVNARVAVEPEALDAAVLAAVAHADATAGARSVAADASSFKPGYPRPVHRLAASDV
ncbi:GTP-binding protein [Dactylosporangium sp. CA-092794]|uniref:GTP-binding protein n=1 Tax=Dactylosporangium sp. CA-092794 TaxID=3239929 RepID=UPI003D94F80E